MSIVSALAIWWRLVVPHVAAGLIMAAFFDFQAAYNSFYWSLLVISSDLLRTVPLVLAVFATQWRS